MNNLAKTNPSLNPQIYRQADDGSGNPRYFFIGDMVEWAEEHAEQGAIQRDDQKALKLIENGTVDVEHVMNHTINQAMKPVVVCLGAATDGGNQIVDGNHRYVAFCYAALETGRDLLVPALLVEPGDWQRFVVPDHMVPKLGLNDN